MQEALFLRRAVRGFGHCFCLCGVNDETNEQTETPSGPVGVQRPLGDGLPFYNIVLPHYVHPMAMVSASLVATALFSLVPLLWQKAEKVERADIRKLIGAALLIGVLRKVFIMYGLSMTSPIDGSIIDTIVPLLVLALSVLLGMDRFTRLKITDSCSAWRELWRWCWPGPRRRTRIRISGET